MAAFVVLIILILLIMCVIMFIGWASDVKRYLNTIKAKDADLEACVTEHKEMLNLTLYLKEKIKEKEEKLKQINMDWGNENLYHLGQKEKLIKECDSLKEKLHRQDKAVTEATDLVLKTNASILKDRQEIARLTNQLVDANEVIVNNRRDLTSLRSTQEWVDQVFQEMAEHVSAEAEEELREKLDEDYALDTNEENDNNA